MKQLTKQSMKELVQFALDMPVGDLERYGTLFLSGPIPAKMTRGELIALQLIERASYGDLDAIKEIRNWVSDDPKNPAAGGGTNYYQFLIQVAGGKPPEEFSPETVKGLTQMAKTIDAKAHRITENLTPSPILDDLE